EPTSQEPAHAPDRANNIERMSPNGIRFTQDTVSPNFSDGGTISDAVRGLRQGVLRVDDFPPIRVVEYKGNLYTLDNRRLTVFKAAQVDEIPVRRVELDDPGIRAEFLKKFNPIEGGTKNVVVTSSGRAEARRLLREYGKYSD